jgi:RHS repeat-associated protein
MKRKAGVLTLLVLMLLCLSQTVFSADQVFFYHTDPAGTPLAMTNASGQVVWKADYKPFGEENTVTTNPKNTKEFVGKEKDEETGVYYFGARYMEPKIGRFTAVDPVSAVDSRTSKTNAEMLLNPQRLNSYTYALNNPYRYMDIDGRLTVNIWDYKGKDVAWGHASITLENGTHISWWPNAEGRDRNPIFPQIYTAPANKMQEFADDIRLEERQPDHQIKIIGLDEGKIENWWREFKKTNQWKTLTQNCSTTASDALKEGGGENYTSWWRSHNLIWTPSDVNQFASGIKENLEK